jgi:DNA modification methylase
MARRHDRPVHLAWRAAPPLEVAPARLELQSKMPAPARGPAQGRLINGDNLAVMKALEPELEGRIDLVYIDPPFYSDKSFSARVGADEDSRKPGTWKTTAGYEDRWTDLAAYLDMLRPRLEAIHRLLAATGTLYVHLDWRAGAYVRVLLDEIFGPDRLLNEVVWTYHGPSPIQTAFSRKHDTLLAFTKTAKYTFNANAVRVPYDPATVKAFASSSRAGFGKVPDLKRGKVPEDWWFFPVVARLHRERTGYPTQKPLALLERIVAASSRPGDLVADFFCGSGTTLVAAARHKRRWIGCDASRLAHAIAYRRLLLECPGESFEALGTPTRRRTLARSVTFDRDGSQLAVRARSAQFQWLEADWSFDGVVFCSRSRAVRPWRSSAPLPPLTHRLRGSGPHRVALRAADETGQIYFLERMFRG